MVRSKNLNLASLKDNYPLPSMEHVLQSVTGSGMMSMLDIFLSYNKVLLLEGDRYNTAFTTPWETYGYFWMPFGLLNVGVTFQCAMDFVFFYFLYKCIVVYHDNITVFSKE